MATDIKSLMLDLQTVEKFILGSLIDLNDFQKVIKKYNFPKTKTNLYRGGYLNTEEAIKALDSGTIKKDAQPIYSFSASDKVATSFFKGKAEDIGVSNVLMKINNIGFMVEDVYLTMLNIVLRAVAKLTGVPAPIVNKQNLMAQTKSGAILKYIRDQLHSFLSPPEVKHLTRLYRIEVAEYANSEKEIVVLSPLLVTDKDIMGLRVYRDNKKLPYRKVLESKLANQINKQASEWVDKSEKDSQYRRAKILTITKHQIAFSNR